MSKSYILCYQLRVHLMGSNPEIWRRILVPANADLQDLHWALQGAFGWENAHLFNFSKGCGRHDRPFYPDWGYDFGAEPDYSNAPKLADVLPVGSTLVYTYDMGDNWKHEIVCEALMIKPPRIRLPACIDGERNHAIEDVGGIWGYQEILEILDNWDNPEYKEALSDLLDSFGKSILKYNAAAFEPKKVKFNKG
ncbi:plasmid pRiA4b ORF-3 family protein [Conchiformibius steedae]|uniref:Plasmid pRiA4b ORF-3 family protein n=1 Tax=Conchiformibius steedae TaxID=153493 RepID=A0A3P2A0S8_9NEIS|nr:plasmid pRiA4b ORF-3 family protein [Conchiformibius steedae]RRD89014.1 plasmid pRiA4b ORF-3 family protein [Conchiformibius steedae]